MWSTAAARKGLGAPSGVAPIMFYAARAGASRRLPQLCPRPHAARRLLGAPQVSPHDVCVADLRAPRSVGGGRRRRAAGAVGPPRAAPSAARRGLESSELSLLPPPGERLWTLNAVRVPEGVDEAAVRRQLLQRFNIEIGAGLGPLAGRIWRVGLMGASSTEALVTLCLSALTNRCAPSQFSAILSRTSLVEAWYASCSLVRQRQVNPFTGCLACPPREIMMTLRASHVSPRLTSAAPWLVAFLTIVATGCATNPVTGKHEMSFMSEAQEIAIGQQADAEIRREMGVYDNPELQRYVSDIGERLAALSHRPNLPWTLHRRRSSGDQRVCAARRIHLHHARNSAVSQRRGGACRAFSATRSLTSRRATRRSSTRARRPVASARRCSASSCPRRSRSAISRPSGWACVPQIRPRRRERVGSRRHGLRRQGGLGSGGVPRFLSTLARVDALTERGVPNWLSTHPEPAARVAEAQPLAAKLAASASQHAKSGRVLPADLWHRRR